MTKETILSPEELAAIKEIIENEVGIDFAKLFKAYQEDLSALEFRDGKKLTEADLINDILDNGKAQSGDEASFENIVTTGTLTIAVPFGLI